MKLDDGRRFTIIGENICGAPANACEKDAPSLICWASSNRTRRKTGSFSWSPSK